RGYADRGVDCVLFSSYSEDPMFGIQAQGYAASHGLWVSVSVPAQCSHALGSRLIAPSGAVQGTVPVTSGVLIETLDAGDPRWDVALNRAKPWRTRARAGAIYRALRGRPAEYGPDQVLIRRALLERPRAQSRQHFVGEQHQRRSHGPRCDTVQPMGEPRRVRV